MGKVIDIKSRKELTKEQIKQRLKLSKSTMSLVEPKFTKVIEQMGIDSKQIVQTMTEFKSSFKELDIDENDYFGGSIFESYDDFKNNKDLQNRDATGKRVNLYNIVVEEDTVLFQVDSKLAKTHDLYYRILTTPEGLILVVCVDAIKKSK